MIRTPLPAILNILSWELLRLVPYRDAVGKWTVGWGHLLDDDEPRKTLTRREANELFELDLARIERGVLAALPAAFELEDHQFGALVSFCFNTGPGALGPNMGLGQALRERRFADVPAEMRRWVNGTVKGVKAKLPGLVERREAEVALWEGR